MQAGRELAHFSGFLTVLYKMYLKCFENELQEMSIESGRGERYLE